MTKVSLNVENVSEKCIFDCNELIEKLNSAINAFNGVKFPFSCGQLDDAKESIYDAINLTSEYSSLLNSGVDFCLNNESKVISDISQIDNLII